MASEHPSSLGYLVVVALVLVAFILGTGFGAYLTMRYWGGLQEDMNLEAQVNQELLNLSLSLTTLQQLRAGDTAGPIARHETRLSGGLVGLATLAEAYPGVQGVDERLRDDDVIRILDGVRSYRERHPASPDWAAFESSIERLYDRVDGKRD